MRRTAALFLVLTIVLLGRADAQAQTYAQPPAVGGTPLTPPPGGVVSVGGTGCPIGMAVQLSLDGLATGATNAGDDGAFSAQVAIPAATNPGPHVIQAACGPEVLDLDISVSPAAVASGPLPRTGTDTTIPLASVALALVGVGGLLVVVTRRGRRSRFA